MRMNAYRGIQSDFRETVVLICHINGDTARLFRIGRDKHARNTGSPAPLQDVFRCHVICVKFSVVDMRVSVKELGAAAVVNGISHGLLRNIGTRQYGVVELDNAVTVTVLNGEDHAVALKTHHLSGLQVNDHRKCLTDKVFRLVVLGDA